MTDDVDGFDADGADGGADAESPIMLPPSRKAGRKKPSLVRTLVEWVLVVGGSLGFAILIQAFVFQPFRIPSGSMIPTLKDGDRIVVNKLSYDVHDVHRGDVVVFTRPKCDTAGSPKWANCGVVGDFDDLVKRVIGLPGDKLYIANSHVYVDGRALDEPYVRKGAVTLAQPPYSCGFSGTISDPYVVPKGMAFVMGVNRDDSLDSRCFGPIPESTIVGRAFVKIWPFNRFGGL
jgi:signal peptidase I